MTLQWLSQWWNLIFIAPFALAMLYLALYTATGLSLRAAATEPSPFAAMPETA